MNAEKIKKILEREFIGPRQGENESLDIDPQKSYGLGMLFPAEQDIPLESSSTNSAYEHHGNIRNSSLSISFLLPDSEKCTLTVNMAGYRKKPKEGEFNSWLRVPYIKKIQLNGNHEEDIEFPPARIIVSGKRTDEGVRYIISVRNRLVKMVSKFAIEPFSAEEIVFQPMLQVNMDCHGQINGFLPLRNNSLDSDKFALTYRERVRYASASGCAASWAKDHQGRCVSIQNTFLPIAEFHELDYSGREHHALSFEASIHCDTGKFHDFARQYEEWIKCLELRLNNLSKWQSSGEGIVRECREALSLIRKGITELEGNSQAADAFKLASWAVLMQFSFSKGRFDYEVVGKEFRWRPFQLAFFLKLIPTIVSAEAGVETPGEVLWFPTGSGKTEAYLSATAFAIFYQRLRRLKENPKTRFGTAVFSRYTLRLLTQQQFQRSARLVAAIELLRRDNPEKLGNDPIRLGLWIGGSQTPNKIKGDEKYPGAVELCRELHGTQYPRKENPFVITSCPYCREPLLPERHSNNIGSYGFIADRNGLKIRCPNFRCSFHEELPILVVDEQIYKNPPAFVISTVDKIARLQWDKDAGNILTGCHGERPLPVLILQDEIHLLEGELGTAFGTWEAAITGLFKSYGAMPALIASSATIPDAPQLVRKLFNRDSRVFPPQGFDVGDCFFASITKESTTRRFIGIPGNLGNMRIMNLLLHNHGGHGPVVSYFNSINELENFTAHLGSTRSNPLGIDPKNEHASIYSRSGSRLNYLLDRLQNSESCRELKVLSVSNMFSVGVDIPALECMVMNGLPKSFAEYLQASGRVGRGKDAMIITLLSGKKPRELAVYEDFINFHETLPIRIEPPCLSPFSPRAREILLHSILIGMLRHMKNGFPQEEGAGAAVNNSDLHSAIKDHFRKIVKHAFPSEQICTEIEGLLNEWQRFNSEKLRYILKKNTGQLKKLITRDKTDTLSLFAMDSIRFVESGVKMLLPGIDNCNLRFELLRIVGNYGPGSLIQYAGESYLLPSADKWKYAKHIRNDEVIEFIKSDFNKLRGFQNLKEPPLENGFVDNKDDDKCGIPLTRFPEWRVCTNSECSSLFHADQSSQTTCPECGTESRQMNYVACCEGFHISEISWSDALNSISKTPMGCQHSHLKMTVNNGIESVSCQSCNLSASVAEIIRHFSGDCRGDIFEADNSCDATLKIAPLDQVLFYRPIQKTFFSFTQNVNQRTEPLLEKLLKSKNYAKLEQLQKDSPRYNDAFLNLLSEIEIATVEELRNLLERVENYKNTQPGVGTCAYLRDDESEFKLIVNLPGSEHMGSAWLKKVIPVNELSSVRVLLGFSRSPEIDDSSEIFFSQSLNIPAVEFKGEGILFLLDAAHIEKCLATNLEADKALNARLEAIGRRAENRLKRFGRPKGKRYDGKFILIHSLSHSFIRLIHRNAGYRLPSIREKLYITPSGCGFLIYAASHESAPAFGSISALAVTKIFERYLMELEHCPNDPICIESAASACHHCLHLPETCCTENNYALDRMILTKLKGE